MQIFPILNKTMLAQEQRSSYSSWNAKVWPSEASAVLLDQTESNIVGKCHRQSFFRLIGVPSSESIDVRAARQFRTGRAMENDITQLAKDAGIFVACGVRFHVKDIDMTLELDLVIIDPETGQLRIAENKTISGYNSKKKIILGGEPKLEGLMQALIYLNEFGTGEVLREAIVSCYQRKQELETLLAEFSEEEKTSKEYLALWREYDRNRVEVNFDNLVEGKEGPIGVNLLYETRDDAADREFVIEMYQGEDGLHYPMVDGEIARHFTIESIYTRFEDLKEYFAKAKERAEKLVAEAGFQEPSEDAPARDIYAYRERVYEELRNTPPEFWPPAEYEWQYSAQKIDDLFIQGKIAKTTYEKFKKRHKGWTWPGAWQCRYCSHRAKCLSQEYPHLAHMFNDFSQAPEDEAA